MYKWLRTVKSLSQSFVGAIVFYTILPLPLHWQPNFYRIARWSPFIGLLIGILLGILDLGLTSLQIPILTRSTLIIAFWVFVTGGLHLDGVIDTADGLAVSEPQRRLSVMQDSSTGAFGVMAAVLVLLLKTAALSDLYSDRFWSLMSAAGWGRWGQVMAIAIYPYLKPTGKGAFHKHSLHLPQDVLLGWLGLVGFNGIALFFFSDNGIILVMMILVGTAIALLTGFWFYYLLKGHTGDTYGAVVEWTEALLLCVFTIFNRT